MSSTFDWWAATADWWNSATFTADGAYRYSLRRRWAPGPHALFCGLNPSKAGIELEDPTTRRWRGYCERWGLGAFEAVNEYGLVSTDPDGLAAAADPIGSWNDAAILGALERRPQVIVACWGAHPAGAVRAAAVLELLGKNVMCFGTTAAGAPRHPLRLPYSQPLVPYAPNTLAAWSGNILTRW